MIKKLFRKTNESIKLKQTLWVGVLIGAVILLTVLLTQVFSDHDVPSQTKKAVQKINIISGGSLLDAEALWRNQVQREQDKTKKSLSVLEENLSTLLAEKEGQIIQMNARLELMERAAKNPNPPKKAEVPPDPFFSNTDNTNDTTPKYPKTPLPSYPEQETGTHFEAGIQKITVNLTSRKKANKKPIKTIDNTIPAGTIAPSVLLSGVDASVSLNASADPTPMLLRIVDLGILPRGFSGDMEGCHVVASSYGDLSSERVFARLEKLSCVERASGEIIETQVAGYVAGGDGRAGIRGRVVSKEGKYLARGFMGGIFSGLSHVASPQKQAGILPIITNRQIPNEKRSDLFKTGMSKGVGSSLDRLSQYYIDRAEQIQPIVQITAGQAVDIVFTSSAQIGTTRVREKITQERLEAREQAARNKEQEYAF